MYAYFDALPEETNRNIAVLETVVGPNFVYDKELPSKLVTRSIGINPIITDSNGPTVNIGGKFSLFLRFGMYVLKTDFYFC